MATVLERRESMSGDWRRLFHGSVLEAITAALSLRRGGLDAGRLHRLAAAARQADPTSRLLVLHALARGTDDGTQRLLLDALLGSDAGRRAHAAWVLGERSHDPRADRSADRPRRQAAGSRPWSRGSRWSAGCRPPRPPLPTVFRRRGRPGLRIAQVVAAGPPGRRASRRRRRRRRRARDVAPEPDPCARRPSRRLRGRDLHARLRGSVAPRRLLRGRGADRARLADRAPAVRPRRLPHDGRAVGLQAGHRGRARALGRPPRAVRRRSPPLRRRRHLRRGTGLPEARRAGRLHARARSALGPARERGGRAAGPRDVPSRRSRASLRLPGVARRVDAARGRRARGAPATGRRAGAAGTARAPRSTPSGPTGSGRSPRGSPWTAPLSGRSRPEAPAIRSLAAAIGSLRERRLGLPLLLTVARLNRVKGISQLVEAWAGDPELLEGFNLVIVGGDLENPTPEERSVLAEIEAVCAAPAGSPAGPRPSGPPAARRRCADPARRRPRNPRRRRRRRCLRLPEPEGGVRPRPPRGPRGRPFRRRSRPRRPADLRRGRATGLPRRHHRSRVAPDRSRASRLCQARSDPGGARPLARAGALHRRRDG